MVDDHIPGITRRYPARNIEARDVWIHSTYSSQWDTDKLVNNIVVHITIFMRVLIRDEDNIFVYMYCLTI